MEFLKNLVRPVVPVKTVSTFYTDGKLTPEEFLAAGDLLHRQCPTWKWEAGDPKKALPFLPPDKQFLIARGIPCRARAKAVTGSADSLQIREAEKGPAEDTDGFGFDIITKSGSESSSSSSSSTPSKPESEPEPVDEDDDEPVDEDDDMPSVSEPKDASAAAPTVASTAQRCRVYEASITYDKLYSSPRFWLRGVDEDGTTPLTQEQIFEDISDEHARKTVTMDTHFHLPLVFASIHPCKHAHTMKMMMDLAKEEEKERRKAKESAGSADAPPEEMIPVDQYFVFFLKFIATICPTMDIDFTVSARL